MPTIFGKKCSIIDVWQGAEHTPERWQPTTDLAIFTEKILNGELQMQMLWNNKNTAKYLKNDKLLTQKA